MKTIFVVDDEIHGYIEKGVSRTANEKIICFLLSK